MKRFILEGLVSLCLFVVIAANAPSLIKTWNGTNNIDEFFVVRQLEVEPFTMFGQTPILYYDRIVKKDFSAKWTATIQKISDNGTFSYYCSGSKYNEYKAGIKSPSEKLNIQWIVDNDPTCMHIATTPGSYRIVVVWNNIDRGPYYLPSRYEIISNVFKILAEGEIINEQAAAE